MSTHKKITAPTMRSGLRSSLPAAFAVAAVGGIGVVVLTGPATPSVTAAPDPCAASSVAKTV
ncbi:MAG: hemophore, partial [Mycobacterium sp.]